MEKAQYPAKTCREAVFNAHDMAYTCELPLMHPGPCASLSVAESVRSRDRWEEKNPSWRDRIGDIDTIV